MMDWIGRLFEPSNNGTASARALLERIGLSPGASAPSVVDAIGAVDAEVGRARRYEYALSIVVLETISLRAASERGGNGDGSGADNGHTIETSVPQMVSLVAAAMLREALRESDVVCYQPTQDRFLLALAESDEQSARTALRRIETLFADRLRLGVVIGIAHFPEDALTRAGLTAVAVSRARQAARRVRSSVTRSRSRREASVTPLFSATSPIRAGGTDVE
jgi:hypothetical protein